MDQRRTTSRLEWLTLAAALAGVTAANMTIFDKLGIPLSLGISAGWGLAIWLFFTLASRYGTDQATATNRYFPPMLQATIMCTALAIPIVRAVGLGADERIDALLMESLRNLCATSAIFTFDPIRRRATLFIGLLLVLFSFTLESSLVVSICLLAQMTIAAFWMSANDSQPWEADKQAGVVRWKLDFISACTLLVFAGFAITFLFYSEKERKVGDSFDSLARQNARNFQSNYFFQEEGEDILIKNATQKKHGEDTTEEGGLNKGKSSKQNYQDYFREFSTIRNKPPEDQDFENLFNVNTTKIRHIPSTHFDQFNGKQWLADKQSRLPAMTSQIADQQGLSKLLNADDLDYSQVIKSLDVSDKDFLEQARITMMKSIADQGAGTLSPDLTQISPADLQRLMQSQPQWSNEAALVVTHYELQALAEQMKADPQLLWKFLATNPSEGNRPFSVLAKLKQWRESQEEPPLPEELAQLVKRWTEDTDPGWEEIMGVVNGLRAHAEYDPQATVPPSEVDSVRYFLVESKRGPDYLFASSAVILLRSLGYPTRMVGGFYANEEKRSWFSGNVTVAEDDVHYWAQVKLNDRVWVDIEPTPGFDIPSAKDERQASTYVTIWNFVAEYGVRLAVAFVCILLLIRLLLRPMQRLGIYLLWRYAPWQSPRKIVRTTQNLLKSRFEAAGLVMAPGKSFANLVLQLDPQRECLQRFHTLGQQAIYHDNFAADSNFRQELRQASQEVVAWATPRRLKDATCAADSAG